MIDAGYTLYIAIANRALKPANKLFFKQNLLSFLRRTQKIDKIIYLNFYLGFVLLKGDLNGG